MTKIYEALDNASNEQDSGRKQVNAAMPVSSNLPKSLEAKFMALAQRIDAGIAAEGAPIVSFTAAQAGESASRIAGEFGKLVAMRFHKRVLLLAAGPMPYVGKMVAGVASHGWEELLESERSIDEVVHPYGDGRICVSQMCRSNMGLPAILNSPRVHQIFDSLRAQFDLIIVDAPPLGASTDAVLLSSVVDGTVVVVDAGKTRWQVIKRWIEQIETQRGQILGVILNKRRDFIPGFIYRKL